MKIEGSGSGSGSMSPMHGSADPDPDPHQNVMDPQHCFQGPLDPGLQEPAPEEQDALDKGDQ